MKTLLGIFTLLLLTFSCQFEPIDTPRLDLDTMESENHFELNSIENAPEQSGYFVTRGEDVIAMVFIDFERGLTASLGVEIGEFCDPFPNFDAFQMIPTQQVNIPYDSDRLQIIQKGEAYFEVYDGVINEFICSFIENTPLIASGTASVVLTDNDLIIYERDDPKNRNAFGFRAKGTLSDQNGDPVDFKAIYRASWDGIDFSAAKEAVNVMLN